MSAAAATGPSDGAPRAQGGKAAAAAAAAAMPDLKKYVDKRIAVRLTANRRVSGVLKGFDHFMNLLLTEATEEHADGTRTPMGPGAQACVVRGQMVVNLEPLTA